MIFVMSQRTANNKIVLPFPVYAKVIASGTFDLLAPPPAVEIGWSETAQQYRKCIGKTAKGKPRIFWLGDDAGEARFVASVLSWCHGLLKKQGI